MCSVLLRGRIEEGWFMNGVLEGKGRILEYTERECLRVYEGEVHQGKPQGIGCARFLPSGEVYEGEWVEGKRMGYGK